MNTETRMFTQAQQTENSSGTRVRSNLRLRRLAGAMALAATYSLGMVGCNNGGSGALVGAGLGAGAGAIIGSAFGHAGTGALIGTGAGLLSGAVIGDQNERNARYREQDYRRWEAQQREQEYRRNNP